MLTSDKEHCQINEKPCWLIVFKREKRKNSAAHFRLIKTIMQLSGFFFSRKRIWRRRRISGDPRHHQGTVRQIWVQGCQRGLLRGCQTSQGHCELWVQEQQVFRAQGTPPLPVSSTDSISESAQHFQQMFFWSGMHIYSLDTSKDETWPLNLINQLFWF